MKIGLNRIIFITITAFIFIWILFFLSFYGIRKLTINEFNKQQMIIAEQAAYSIAEYIEHLADDMDYIINIDGVFELNAEGRAVIEDYYNRNGSMIKTITRMDERGKIVWTIPYNRKFKGADISSQEHIKYLLKEHKTSMSDVFIAVQGFMAVAIHVPVVRHGRFYGSIGALLDFSEFSKKFLENIKIGDDGYAWMLSASGKELYCPVPGHVGRSIYETSSKFPEVISLAERMMRGEKGNAAYRYDLVKEKFVGVEKKQASFTPVKLFNTHWSIVVATPEKKILELMDGLRNKLLFTAILLILITALFTYFVMAGRKLEKEIVQKKKYEAFLIENETVLETALQSVGKLAGGVAHDLNNVFAGIISSTEVLEMKHKGDEKSEKYTGFIKDSASRGTGIVQKILNLSQIGTGTQSFVDLYRIIEEAGSVLQGENGTKVKLKTQLDASDYLVKASPLNLRKVITRLLTRLAQELPDSGGLFVRAENISIDEQAHRHQLPLLLRGDYIKILVQPLSGKPAGDSVIGLFSFLEYSEEPADKADPGISDIYRRVRDIGGAMVLDSGKIPDSVPSVAIYLPVSKVNKTAESVDKSCEPIEAGGTILIVEDDPAIRNALERILRDLGYNVFTAEDGAAGVDIFREEHNSIDLVILDIVMPVKGGVEALKDIMEIDNKALVYMTSGYVPGITIDDMISKGAAGFINKPVTISDLSALVSGAIAERKKNDGGDSSGSGESKA